MAVALSIRNKKAEALARKLAAECGRTITDVIIEALEEKLERIKGRKMVDTTFESIMEISSRCRNLPDIDMRTADEILEYNEHGMISSGY